jgi:hypothetical protein
MSETLKATIVGTIIIGIFMLLSVKMITGTVWDISRSTKSYIEMQKEYFKAVAKLEQRKAKDVFLEGTSQIQPAPAPAKPRK